MTQGAEMIVDDVLINADARVAAWVEMRLGGDVVSVPYVAYGIVGEGGDLIGGVYYFNKQEDRTPDGEIDPSGVSDLCCAVAVDDLRIARQTHVVKKLFELAFDGMKTRRLSAEIDMSNSPAIQQAKAIGFRQEGIKRKAGRNGGDVGLFGLLREECRFLTEG